MPTKMTQRLWSRLWDTGSTILKPYRGQNPEIASSSFIAQAKRGHTWTRSRPDGGLGSKTKLSKSFASCGFLFLEINTPVTAHSSTVNTCAAAVEKSLFSTPTISRPSITSLARTGWRRNIHSSSRRREIDKSGDKSSRTTEGNVNTVHGNNTSEVAPPHQQPKLPEVESTPSSYLHLPHMPKLPHRPTKEELLAAATGFWSRLKVRFKWFSIRSVRPWNIDDWSAFVSWFVLGNIVWVLVGTTTFFSLVIFSINTVVAQGRLF